MAESPKHELSVMAAKRMFLTIDKGDETRWNRELVFAMQAIRASDVLQKCDGDSIKNSVINVASIGISLNPALALAYLVPRGGKCVLDISFRGLVRIATDSGSVLDIDATVVRDKDFFDYEMGLEPRLVHKPYLEGDPGKPKFVYAVAILHNGTKKFIVMNSTDIDKVKATSKARSGPWVEWEGEMWRKTAVKRLAKLLPQTDRMSQAVAVLNEHEGLASKALNAQTIMERFGHEPPKEIEIPTGPVEPTECEFCHNTDGTHQNACPAVEPPEGD